MAARFTTANGVTTITLEYSATTQKVLNTVNAAGREIFRSGIPVGEVVPALNMTPNAAGIYPAYTWDDLSNQQKLNLISDHILRGLLAKARQQHTAEAALAANTEADTLFI